MTIATYAELKIAVANWLGRDDIADARISEFVTLFEAVANRVLRVRQMETSAVLTTVDGSAALPTDFLATIYLQRGSAPYIQLESSNPIFFPGGLEGSPAKFFFIEADFIYVRPAEDTAFGLYYYQKIPALSDSATTNWLLLAHPDLYLYGSLVESEMFLVNDERALSWKSRRDELLEEIRLLSNRVRGPRIVRVTGPTP